MRCEERRIGWAAAALAALLTGVGVSAAEHDARLIDAARSQNPSEVRALLTQHADANARSDDGSTALLWAAHWNDVATADLLLRAGADANAANDLRITPLSQACTNGSAPLVDLLLEAGANPNTSIATGETPLMTCARSGGLDAVRLLLARAAEVNAAEPTENQTALMWAAAEHHPAVVRALIDAGADPQARTRKGFSALHFAARGGDFEIAQLLLAAGVDVNIRSQPEPVEKGTPPPAAGPAYQSTLSAGSTPLLVATVRSQVPFALFLLDHGADANVSDAGFAPLHWAVGTWESGTSNPMYGFSDPMSGIPDRQAKLRLVKALLAHGANPNGRMSQRPPGFVGGYDDADGATPLLIASAAADVELMRLLVAAGADYTLVTATNTTPVMAASGLNRLIGESPITEAQALESVKFLMERGADGRGETTYGENALFGAAYRGWNTLLELLVQHGANVNAVSKAGVTPYLAAAGYGDRLGGVLYNTEGADLLLRHGADPKLGKPCQAQNKCR